MAYIGATMKLHNSKYMYTIHVKIINTYKLRTNDAAKYKISTINSETFGISSHRMCTVSCPPQTGICSRRSTLPDKLFFEVQK